MAKIKITPLLIVLVALEALLIFLTFYYLAIDNKGGNALGGVIALIAGLINGLLIVVEQMIVNIKGINKKVVWTIEIIIIVIAIIIVSKNGISLG